MPRNIKFDAKSFSLPKKRKKVPVWRYPNTIERSYLTDLTQLVKKWKKSAIDIVIPQISGLILAADILIIDSVFAANIDDWVDDLNALMEAFKGSISINEQVAVSELMFTAEQMNTFNAKQWAKVTKGVLGVPLLQAEPWLQPILKGFTKENLDLIQALENQTFKDVSTVVNRGIKEGKSYVTIKNELLGTKLEKGVFNKVETRAQLIARDQIGKLNGQLTKTRQTEVGISRYFWRDSADQRVRSSHSLMDGLLCNWEDSTVYSADDGKTWISRPSGAVLLHPGQDYQCRCASEPDFRTISLENV